MDPAENLTLYVRRGGQLNTWPIFDAGVLGREWVPLPGIDGAATRRSGADGLRGRQRRLARR